MTGMRKPRWHISRKLPNCRDLSKSREQKQSKFRQFFINKNQNYAILMYPLNV